MKRSLLLLSPMLGAALCLNGAPALALEISTESVVHLDGGTIAIKNLNATPRLVVPTTLQARKVTFYNPGALPVFVCQVTDIEGNAIQVGAVGGCWKVGPEVILSFVGAQGAWNAAAIGGDNAALTIAIGRSDR